eukprot:TRINITY_DN36554_c0_g1_i1.p1 TRINITY_DN36554_c0_g1~~TRINITY_DN36554_c0_g1_i1.p1  ORF type:complete len:2313 (+),score=513.22 TRINITY_DN36554_c0_g1_i1:110-7048(+)
MAAPGEDLEEQEGGGNEVSAPSPPPRDPMRGYVGDIYEDVFKDLYEAADVPAAAAEEATEETGAEDAPAADGEAAAEATLRRPEDDVDVSEEEAEAADTQTGLERDHARLDRSIAHLNQKKQQSREQDHEHAKHLQERWNLTVREQIPVGESTLKSIVDPKVLRNEGLVEPRHMMHDVERFQAIKSGLIPHHDNLLSLSKPDEPNYLQETTNVKFKKLSRNIQPTLTQAQKNFLAEQVAERKHEKPPAPKTLNAEERAKNRDIVKRMFNKVNFLKNPRYTVDRTAASKGEENPFAVGPDTVIFRNYEVGCIYQITVELRNTTKVGRRVRVVPCKNPAFSITPLSFESNTTGRVEPFTVIAPGMAAFFTVRFAPSSLNDETESLTLGTEAGDYDLPVLARRVQPVLEFEEPVDCGQILAGEKVTLSTTITNTGGEGSFRLIGRKADMGGVSCHYETSPDSSTLVFGAFRITPATFYLERDQSLNLEITFGAEEVGHLRCPLLIEGDNGQTSPLTLLAVSDAVRLELVGWPTLRRPLTPSLQAGVAPLSLLPWQLNWLKPGCQVGLSSSQVVTISNGSYLPVKAEWRLVAPPRPLLSQLAVGNRHRLTQDVLETIHMWKLYGDSKHGEAICPFTITPAKATLRPFETTEFTFTFHAHAPARHRATVFAYLAAVDLPSGGHCLPTLDRLMELQKEMQPEGYSKGMPLFGGATAPLYDVKPVVDPAVQMGDKLGDETPRLPPHLERASSTVTAVCLQGLSTTPAVTATPRTLILPGDIAPFLSHSREITLKNVGSMQSNFRFQLTSDGMQEGAKAYEPAWIISAEEAGPRAPTKSVGTDAGQDALQQAVEKFSSMWPSLPPTGEGPEVSAMPGYGAAATFVIEPHEGVIQPGETVKIKVTFRVVREVDLDVQLLCNTPVRLGAPETVIPAIKVPLLATVRSPRVELRRTPYIDYGVVRAHSRHTATICVDNPSDLPILVRMRHQREDNVMNPAIPPSMQSQPHQSNAARRACESLLRARGLLPATAALPDTKLQGKSAGDDQEEPEAMFPCPSHQEVVDFFLAAMRSGHRGSHAVVGQELREGSFQHWVHARSGCLDISGRRNYEFTGRSTKLGADCRTDPHVVDDNEDFVFEPACFVLWPQQRSEVQITLRTGQVQKYRAILEAVGFDSMHSQCLEVFAEVQLPTLRLSTQHTHFPVTYLKTVSNAFRFQLYNESDMPAQFRWDIPVQMESGIEVQIKPMEGRMGPRGYVDLELVGCPTKELPNVQLLCNVFVGEVLQPLALLVSATVYGMEVDWAIVRPGDLAPAIVHKPRMTGDPQGDTYQLKVGKAPRIAPCLDFGEMQLGETRELQLVLYNRTGIATPFQVNVNENPAYDPLLKGRKIGSLLDAATRMYSLSTNAQKSAPEPQSFFNEPQAAQQGTLAEEELQKQVSQSDEELNPVKTATMTSLSSSKGKQPTQRPTGGRFHPQARGGGKKSIKRRALLDDFHERQAFRGDTGEEYLKSKEAKELGSVVLKAGRGFAVKVEPGSDWLQPFGTALITLTAFSDLPGKMVDELVVNVRQLNGHMEGKDYRIPMKLTSYGNPLYLPDQQIGLSTIEDPPRLLCGTMVPAEKTLTRHFKVGNNSAAPIKVSWQVLAKSRINSFAEERSFMKLALCKKGDEDPFAQHCPGQDVVVEPVADDEELDAMIKKLEEEGFSEDEDLAGAPFEFDMWARPPPKVKDPFAVKGVGAPPVCIEPPEAVLPAHGSSQFTVTMTASKATTTARNHYHYVLVGKGRFTEDREELLAAAAAPPDPPKQQGFPVEDEDGKPRPPIKKTVPTKKDEAPQVRDLPNMRLSNELLHDDDSDIEETQSQPEAPLNEKAASRASMVQQNRRSTLRDRGRRPLPTTADPDIVSTFILECVGDCIRPMLTVDKKASPGIEDYTREVDEDGMDEGADAPRNCPVFKFTHSVGGVPPSYDDKPRTSGAVHGGARGGSQHPGVASCMVRTITLANQNECSVNCRFRVDGPFRINQIVQAGAHPVKRTEPAKKSKRSADTGYPSADVDPLAQLFSVSKRDTIVLAVEFVPDMVPQSEWTNYRTEHTFGGNLTVEYPHDLHDVQASVDLQRIRLSGTSRRPAMKVTLVPHAGYDPKPQLELAHLPPWSAKQPILVEFGYTHVEASVKRMRTVLLTNETPVTARWRLLHVGRKRRPAHDIGNALREDEDFRALDDREVFEFDMSDGILQGPSKDVAVAGSHGHERQPHWCPVPKAQHRARVHSDEHLYEPQRINIVFRPQKNELYKCKFRIQVEGGLSIDFICRGCGSYDEEDDILDFEEA